MTSRDDIFQGLTWEQRSSSRDSLENTRERKRERAEMRKELIGNEPARKRLPERNVHWRKLCGEECSDLIIVGVPITPIITCARRMMRMMVYIAKTSAINLSRANFRALFLSLSISWFIIVSYRKSSNPHECLRSKKVFFISKSSFIRLCIYIQSDKKKLWIEDYTKSSKHVGIEHTHTRVARAKFIPAAVIRSGMRHGRVIHK